MIYLHKLCSENSYKENLSEARKMLSDYLSDLWKHHRVTKYWYVTLTCIGAVCFILSKIISRTYEVTYVFAPESFLVAEILTAAFMFVLLSTFILVPKIVSITNSYKQARYEVSECMRKLHFKSNSHYDDKLGDALFLKMI